MASGVPGSGKVAVPANPVPQFPMTFKGQVQQNWLECSLCLGPYEDPYALKCLDAFCRDCIAKTIETAKATNQPLKCPICQESYKLKDVRHDRDKYKRMSELWSRHFQGTNPYENIHKLPVPWALEEPHKVRLSPEGIPLGYVSKDKSFAGVSVRDYLILDTCTLSGTTEVTKGSLNAKNSNFESIKAGDLSLTGCIVQGEIESTRGGLQATRCTLVQHVSVTASVVLRDTDFFDITVTKGGVDCKKNSRDVFRGGNIHARDEIKLENINLNGDVKTTKGFISSINCQLGRIEAEGLIILDNTFFASATSYSGGVVCHHNTFDEAVFHGLSICAQNAVSLEMLRLSGNVQSQSGEVVAKQSFVDSIQAAQSVKLKDTTVVTKVQAGGAVIAKNSKVVGEIACVSELRLHDSTVGCVEIQFPYQKGKIHTITVVLDGNSTIEGDLIIKQGETVQEPPVINGHFSVPAISQETCVVKITGSGKILGSVQFDKCTGGVERPRNMDIVGGIQKPN